jgi:hypothetical protein
MNNLIQNLKVLAALLKILCAQPLMSGIVSLKTLATSV